MNDPSISNIMRSALPTPTEVSNPRRILAVALEESSHHLRRVIEELTNKPIPPSGDDSLAGSTVDLSLGTHYYTARIPVWLDLVSDPAEWASSFLSAEAKEVLSVLGGVVLVFALPDAEPAKERTRGLIAEFGRVVREGLGGFDWDGVAVAVGVGEDVVGGGEEEEERRKVRDEWEDVCDGEGIEFVACPLKRGTAVVGNSDAGTGMPKEGVARALEALEANDWSQGGGFGEDDDEEEAADESEAPADKFERKPKDVAEDLDPESLEFGFDREDFAGLRKAIWDVGRGADEEEGEDKLGEEDVQKMEGLMQKLIAVRDMSAGLPDDQRKRMARQAVGEVMKEL